MIKELRLDEIIINGRNRKDLGDIKSLADSLGDCGLIQPVVVDPDHHLVAGERRIAAARSLGWELIPVVVIHTLPDAISRLRAERDENACRKDFTPSELVALGRQLEELERPKRTPGQRTDLTSTSKDVEVSRQHERNPTDTAVADGLGIKKTTYQRLKVVDRAQSDSNPEIATLAKDQMALLDAGGTTISSAATVIREKRQATPAEPEVIEHLPTKIYGPRPNHLKILSRVTVNLSGMVIALDDIEELNDTVNKEEAGRLRSDLSKSIRSLNRISNLLKERTK